jgi:LacI family transcriptional regulator
MIGVVFPDIHETFMTHVLKGIEQTLYPIGYRLIIAPYAPFCPRQASRTHIEEAIERNVPIVAVDRYLPGLLERAVVADDYGDAVRAVEQLHVAGCRSVGYVGFEINISSLKARFAGYRDATKRLGLEAGARVFLGSRNLDSGDLTNTLTKVSRSAAMPDAFLVTTNGLSYRVADILRRLGAGGVKIAKFGEDPVWANTGMLEIRQPHEALGRTAAALLTSTMRGEAPEAKPVVVESGEYL